MSNYIGRFAPSPSGRMHLGNVYAGLMAWLFAQYNKGAFLLRCEDIDTQRCKKEYAEVLLQDLAWLGITYDEKQTVYQTQRTMQYEKAFNTLKQKGLVYPCYCTRADLHTASAPHESDGHFIYSGKCRGINKAEKPRAFRVITQDEPCSFIDGVYGKQSQNAFKDWGDFVIKRGDGGFCYQLAVVVDDFEFGITHIVRGRDLLQSVCAQRFLQKQLCFAPAQYSHLPLLVAPDKKRLSKREKSLDMGALRQKYKNSAELLGALAFKTGIIDKNQAISASELAQCFNPQKIKPQDIVITDF